MYFDIGFVKSNVGHAESISGWASIVKVILTFEIESQQIKQMKVQELGVLENQSKK